MRYILVLMVALTFWNCNTKKHNIQEVASFKGKQVTGVTVSNSGRIFANFPRWRTNVKNSVIEVFGKEEYKAFPNENWNSWKLGEGITDTLFVAVQSVVAFENTLYVLDTRNPLFGGVLDNPKIFTFDLSSNKLIKTYTLTKNSFHTNSYINDLRIDKKNGKIYLTDSGHAGLVVVDLQSGKSFRVLDNHSSTLAETDELTFSNGVWKNTVHSDGIALDTQNNKLYYHALTGYNLYAIPTKALLTENNTEIENSVELVAKTPAPDGMIIDKTGNLFLADLENDKIMKFEISNGVLSVFAEGKEVKWADSFSIYNNELYFTNSRINEASGDISQIKFSINKIEIN